MRRALTLSRRLASASPLHARALTTAVAWQRPDAHDYLRDILESRVYDVATQTPLQFASPLSNSLPNKTQVFLKREDLQATFSFNVRGAYNKLAHLTNEQRQNGIVACAAGNHLHGIAYAAGKLGIDVVMVTPVGTARMKSPPTSPNNVHLIEFGSDFEAAEKEAFRIAHAEGRTLVHPFNDPLVIAGHGTIGMEILRQTSGQWPDAIFCPVGGGGLLAGVAAYVKAVAPHVQVFGVEPEGANLLEESLRLQKRVTFPVVNRFTDEAGVHALGAEPYRMCASLVDGVIRVSTDEICSAIKDVFGNTRALMEPLGAISVAGLKKYAKTMETSATAVPKKFVAVLAAANMDFDRLRFVSERSDDRERFVAVQIPECRGSFQRLYNLVYPRNVTEFTYRMNSQRDNQAQICMSFQTKSSEEFNEVLTTINRKSDMQAIDLTDNELAKAHLRHLAGGRAEDVPNERLIRLEFPERPGALKEFLDTLGDASAQWNVSLFHYRNHGADIGRVLVGFQVSPRENEAFKGFLDHLGFQFVDESENPAYTQFLM